MVKKGFVLSVNDPEPKEYIVIDRLDDFAHGEGGWLLAEKGSPLECWRVNDKYLEIQIQRGVIEIVKQNED